MIKHTKEETDIYILKCEGCGELECKNDCYYGRGQHNPDEIVCELKRNYCLGMSCNNCTYYDRILATPCLYIHERISNEYKIKRMKEILS